ILSLWLPSLMESFFRGSHTSNFVTCGFSKSYNQAAEVPSSKREVHAPRNPSISSRIMLPFVAITHSITIFPHHSSPQSKCFPCAHPCRYTFCYPLRAFLSVGIEASTQNLLQKPFYVASDYRTLDRCVCKPPFTLALAFAIVLRTFTCLGRFSAKKTRQLHRPQSPWAVPSIAPSPPRVLSPHLY